MDQIRSQIFAGDAARLRRLGEMLILIADLPDSGGCILVGDRRTRVEVYDLILQHRGTAVLSGTSVYLTHSADDEQAAVGGIDPDLIYLAPGYTAHGAIARGGQPKPEKVNSTGRSGVSPLGALGPLGHRIEVVERDPVPGALRHAWPCHAEDPPPVPPTRGPWHRPVVA